MVSTIVFFAVVLGVIVLGVRASVALNRPGRGTLTVQSSVPSIKGATNEVYEDTSFLNRFDSPMARWIRRTILLGSLGFVLIVIYFYGLVSTTFA